jgi:hypothetical protein
MLDAIETDIGASPVLYLRSGAQPRRARRQGTTIATIAMGAMRSPMRRPKAIAATISDLSADNAGTLGHWRIKTSGAVVKLQGSITASGGGGDMTVDNTSVIRGQQIDVTSFAINFPSANQG